jgi:hypothetical protein
MLKGKRVPDKHVEVRRDGDGRRENTVKSRWHHECFVTTYSNTTDEEGVTRKKKHRVRKLDAPSLKQFAAILAGEKVDQDAAVWLSNKGANTSRPNLGIGKTRGKKSKNKGGK